MSMININELHKIKNQKKERKKKVFEDILKMCHNKIKIVANSEENAYCFFKVPLYIYGNPLYDMKSCVIYLIKSLVKNGFNIKYYHPYIIFISWEGVSEKKPEKDNSYKLLTNDSYKSIEEYKPSGNFILNNNNLNLFENKSNRYLN